VLRRLGRVNGVITDSAERVVGLNADCELRAVSPLAHDDPCDLVVLDLRAGARREYALPDRRAPGPDTLSPDGHLLALSFPGLPPDSTDAQASRSGVVNVLDLRTGVSRRVPGVVTPKSLLANHIR